MGHGNMTEEIDLRSILSVLRRRIWMILLIPILAALTAALLSIYVLHPTYSASTTLWVIKQETATLDYNTLLTNRNLVKTYAEVAKSRAVIDEVVQKLALPFTAEQMQKRLSVTPVRDTEIIQISITDSDPSRSAAIADAVAASFMDQLANYIKLENVRVVDRARIPVDPIKPRPVLNTAIAGVLGGMVAVGIAFLSEYLDTTIKTTDDIERQLGLPVLAVIPQVDLQHEAQHSPKRRKSVAPDRQVSAQ